MSGYHQIPRIVLWILLVCCLLVLTKYILFKRSPEYYKNYFAHHYSSKVISDGWKHANLKPFSTIYLFYRSTRLREEYKYDNIGGNIVGFMPLGILFPALFFAFRSFWRVTLICFCISLIFETTQLLTGLGSFDVDDIILNTSGGIAGYLVYLVLKKIIRDEPGVSSQHSP